MPEGRRLTDAEIAASLSAAAEGVADGSGCPSDDRYWELACGALGVLGAQEAGSLLDHAASCSKCWLALQAAHELSDAPQVASPSLAARVWSALAGSVLRPAPALAYLVLLVASIPAYRVLTDRAEPILRDVRVVPVHGDIALRGSEPVPPLRISLAGNEAPVLKLLIDADRLRADPAPTRVRVRLLEEEAIVAESTHAVSEFDADGSIAVVLDRAALRAGPIYRVEVVPDGVGAASPPLFRQSFRVDPAPRAQ
jgi:hypothetical protein